MKLRLWMLVVALACSPRASKPDGLPAATAEALVTAAQARFALRPSSAAFLRHAPAAQVRRQVMRPSQVTSFRPDGARFTPVFAGAAPVQLAFPATAERAFRVSSVRPGMALEVRLRGARPVKAEQGGGYVVYRGGHDSGGDIMHRLTPRGTEDFVVLPEARSTTLSYDVELASGVAGLRLVANMLEFVDAQGAPRLRVNVPYTVDSRGTSVEGRLLVHGCAVDASPAAPVGRPVVPPGASHCTVDVALNGLEGLDPPLLVDPAWQAADDIDFGSIGTGLMGHLAVEYAPGKVLVAGGTTDGMFAMARAWLFDATTNPPSWANTAPMSVGRYKPMGIRSGANVVAASGVSNFGTFDTVASAELYDPLSGTWRATNGGGLNTSRLDVPVLTMDDGRTLIVGGLNINSAGAGNTVLSSVEIYGPVSEAFTTNGAWSLPNPRWGHAISALTATTFLLSGGALTAPDQPGSSAAFVFDVTGHTWTSVSSMFFPRQRHTQVTLPDGKVLVAGGQTTGPVATASAEIFDPTIGLNGAWSLASSMVDARMDLQGSLLSSGVLVVGGGDGILAPPAATYIFNPTANTWTSAGSTSVGRAGQFTLTPILTGDTRLVVGGDSGTGNLPVAAVDLFISSANGIVCNVNGDCTSGFCVDGVCCATACAGGAGDCQACSVAAGGLVNGTCSALVNHTVCRPAAGMCDAAEECDGVATTCPADVKSTAVCRPRTTACDAVESCDGTHDACPIDGVAVSGTLCRAAAGTCDVAEVCNGITAVCPADLKSRSVCRDAVGICDVAETCDGASNACPADTVVAAGTLCRAVAGVCDLAEVCSGASGLCPDDAKSTAVCRPAAGACDVAERCNGGSNDCPANLLAVGTICRAAAGVCDLAETCSGVSADCPSDARSVAVCGAAPGSNMITNGCTGPRTCNGSGNDCPASTAVAVGSSCDPGGPATCNAVQACQATMVFVPNSPVMQRLTINSTSLNILPFGQATFANPTLNVISMALLSDTTALGMTVASPIIEFGPANTVFDPPAEVTIPLRSIPLGLHPVVFHCDNNLANCQNIKSTNLSGAQLTGVSINISSFSKVFVTLEPGPDSDAGVPDAGTSSDGPAADAAVSVDSSPAHDSAAAPADAPAVSADGAATVADGPATMIADGPVATLPDAAATPAKDGAVVEAGASKPADDSGCSCRVAGPSGGRPALVLVVGFGALLMRRRRR